MYFLRYSNEYEQENVGFGHIRGIQFECLVSQPPMAAASTVSCSPCSIPGAVKKVLERFHSLCEVLVEFLLKSVEQEGHETREHRFHCQAAALTLSSSNINYYAALLRPYLPHNHSYPDTPEPAAVRRRAPA